MKAIAAEVVDTGEKRDGQGRRLIKAQERAAMISAYERSGMTQKAFAQREGIKFCTFAGWLRRSRQQNLVPKQPAFTEVRLPEARQAWALEVTLPNGIVIRATGAQGMSEVVNALRPC